MKVQAKSRVVLRRAPKDGAPGNDGLPGITLQLSPERIVLDTDADGIVRNFSVAVCTVQLLRGTGTLTPAVFITQQVRCAARVQGSVVRITSVSIDPATGYSFGSAYVDLSVSAAGQTLKTRLSVEVNLQRTVARLEKTNREIAQEVELVKKTSQGQTESLAQLKVQQGRILAQVSETTMRRYNLLRDTKTLRGDCTLGTGVEVKDRDMGDFTVAAGTAPSGRWLDVLRWQNVDGLKPDTSYTLSFWARGSGTAGVYLYPDTCARSTNSQGHESTQATGESIITLSGEWRWYWVTFRTRPNVDGKKTLIPFRLMNGASGSIYGVCFVEGERPTQWVPYRWDPQLNYIATPLAVQAHTGDITEETVLEDPALGTVKRITSEIGRNFQMTWQVADYTLLNNRPVTLFVVLKEEDGAGNWHFGGWNDQDEFKGSFSFVNARSNSVDLGNGWRKYYSTFYNVNNRLWNGVSSFGLNSLKGTVQVYAAGVVLGEECPEWNSIPMRRKMLNSGLDIDKERIALNGRTVFKSNNAAEVPLFDENGKMNPQLSTAQYLMNVLRSMETMIDGGLVIAGLMAAKDGNQVTAYLNGLRQKTHALAAGVKNFGTDAETSVSHINFDGSAQFGHLGIDSEGSVSIIDAENFSRIHITPDRLPQEVELLKTIKSDVTQPLGNATFTDVKDKAELPIGGEFSVADGQCMVIFTATLSLSSTVEKGFKGAYGHNVFCGLRFRNRAGEVVTSNSYIGYPGGFFFFISGNPTNSPNLHGDKMVQTLQVRESTLLPKGTWQTYLVANKGDHVYAQNVQVAGAVVTKSYRAGVTALRLCNNGLASVGSSVQATFIRDGKLYAYGEMNVPGVLLAGTVNKLGELVNKWGEYVEGTGLRYMVVGGVTVLRLTFGKALPCGSNYAVTANANDNTTPWGYIVVVRNKTEWYCDFRIVNDSGGEATNVGIDFIVVGKNRA